MKRLFSFLVALIISAPAWATQPADHQLEAAARNFRIATYQSYRTDRGEYDRRIAACSEAVKRFYLASNEQGRVQIRQWFEEVKSGQAPAIPEVPQIELAKSLPKSKRSREAKESNAAKHKDGFEITKYESNPRFKSRFSGPHANHDETLVSAENDESQGVGGLFSSIGKSFLKGSGKRTSRPQPTDPEENKPVAESPHDESPAEDSAPATEVIQTDPAAYEGVEDPFAPTDTPVDAQAVAETNAASFGNGSDAVADSPAKFDVDSQAGNTSGSPDGTDVSGLNKKILNFNLTVEMLQEDLGSAAQKSVDGMVRTVEQLEAANATFTEIFDAQMLLSREDRDQLSKLASLEEVATQVMTSINELMARQGSDQSDTATTNDVTNLEDLRMRVSKVLAHHAF